MKRDVLLLISEICRRLADKEGDETTNPVMPSEDKVAKSRQMISEGFKGLMYARGPSLPFETVNIAPGSTLWNLAKIYLGNGQLWREIYLMNIDTISKWQEIHNQSITPDLIYPGQTLRILDL